jgi:hypothetical protein
MVTLAGIGAAAQGIGSLASSFGLGNDEGPGFMEQRNNNEALLKDQTIWNNYEAPQYRVAAAVKSGKEYGLHPLSLLGVQPVGGNTSTYVDGGANNVDMAQLGQGIDRALNSGRTQTQKRLDELALEKAELSNDYLEVQIAGAKRSIANSGASPTLGNKGLSGSTSSKLPLSSSDLVELVKDQEVTSKLNRKDTTAGNHPAWSDYKTGRMKTRLPKADGGWAEAIGELPIWYKYPKMAEILYKTYEDYTPGYWMAKKYKQWKSRK